MKTSKALHDALLLASRHDERETLLRVLSERPLLLNSLYIDGLCLSRSQQRHPGTMEWLAKLSHVCSQLTTVSLISIHAPAAFNSDGVLLDLLSRCNSLETLELQGVALEGHSLESLSKQWPRLKYLSVRALPANM